MSREAAATGGLTAKTERGEWRVVASVAFGLGDARLLQHRQHHSDHYFLEARQQRFVLSRSPVELARPAFTYQFAVLHTLLAAGFAKARLPVPAVTGAPFAQHDGGWWVLRRFGDSDASPAWSSPELVEQAARVLAELHVAGAALEGAVPDLASEDLDPFHWTTTEFLAGLASITARFDWSQLDAVQRDRLHRSVEALAADSEDVLEGCRELQLFGLTHQDYRPVNLRVLDGVLVEIWDWDLARLDWQLYDVAFGALQFGGRECLFPDVSLELAVRFVDTYLHARGFPTLRRARPDLLAWFLRYAVLKRLVMGWHVQDRLELLDRIERSPLQPVSTS